VLAAHPHPKVVAVVHAETSTGVRNDVEPVGAALAGTGALLLVDCVTSLAGIPVAVDAWGVDIAYGGTQKCLGVAPGLSPFTMNESALSRRVERPRSWYLDLGLIAEYVTAGGGGRKYHHTAPVAMIRSLHAALGVILEEGLEAGWARHQDCGRRLQDGLQKLGLELWAEEGHRLPELTTVLVPDGVDDRVVRAALLDRYGIEIGGGVGAYAGKVWRIGCMGHTARPSSVTLLLAALAEVLGR
jgi:alanine-glyoxylate transaminase / serine-glyoxylate transaminase / serine-pyruvate transaminase